MLSLKKIRTLQRPYEATLVFMVITKLMVTFRSHVPTPLLTSTKWSYENQKNFWNKTGTLMIMQPQPARPLNYAQVNLIGMTFAFLIFIYLTPAPSAMNVKVKTLRSERLEEAK